MSDEHWMGDRAFTQFAVDLIEQMGEALQAHRDSGEYTDTDGSCYISMDYDAALAAYERGPQ